jgi:multiple sugar transport system substrate-binding protein
MEMRRKGIKNLVITMLVVGIAILAPALAAADSGFDWKKFDGQTIHFLGCAGPYNNTIQEAIPLFKAKTGITVVANFLPETDFFNKVQLVAAAGAGEYDNYMVGFPNMIDWVPANWLEPLDSYISNAQVTNPDQNMADFFPNALKNVRWDGVKGHRFGSGTDAKLWALPLGQMINMLMYRKDIFDKYNLKVPTTIDEAIAVGKVIQSKEKGMYGIATRGVKEIQQLFGGVWSTMESYGATDFDASMKPAFNSDGMVKGLNDWKRMIKEIGNINNWASMTWYDVMTDLTSGKAAMALDACAIGGWINSGKDSVAKGKIAFAEPLHGPDVSKERSFMWAWNIAVAAGSKNKVPAWYFTQFVTSKDMQLKGSDMSWPTRKSVFDDPGFQKGNVNQPRFFDAWDKTIKYAGFEFSPVPGLNDWGYQLAGQIQDVVLDRTPAAKAMQNVCDYYNKNF